MTEAPRKDCATCGAPLEPSDGTCVVCAGRQGAPPIRAGFVEADAGMEVCHSCGAAEATHATSCGTCGAPTNGSHEGVPPNPDMSYWAQLRTELTCVTCGEHTKVVPDAAGRPVVCVPCGTAQVLDPSVWGESFAHAHAVADLAATDAAARRLPPLPHNPHADVGTFRANAVHESRGAARAGGAIRTRNLRTTACPGHPLCARCGSPLGVEAAEGRATTVCPGCADRVTHRAVPEVAAHLGSAALAVVGAAFRDGEPPDASPDAHAPPTVVCPGCGAALELGERAHFATCDACGTECEVPSRRALDARPTTPGDGAWWILLRGTSEARRALDAIDEAPSARVPSERPAAGPGPRGPLWLERARSLRDVTRRGDGAPAAPRDPRAERRAWALQIGVPLVVVTLVAALGFGPAFAAWSEGHTSSEHAAAQAAPPGAPAR